MLSRKPEFRSSVLLIAAAMAIGGCEREVTGTLEGRPVVSQVTLGANPFNSLSAVVAFQADQVDSARVVYWAATDPKQATPFYPVNDAARIVTLGLLPKTTYALVVEAVGEGGVAVSDTARFLTGELPLRLQDVSIAVTGAAPEGLTMVTGPTLGTPGLVYAFDGAGRIRWYREFSEYPKPPQPAKETKQHSNGNFTTFIGESSGYELVEGRYIEYRPTGEIVRTYQAGPGYYTDSHELLLTFDDTTVHRAHLFGYSHRNADLRSIGGQANVQLADHYIIRKRPDGSAEWIWNSGDYFDLEDWIEPPVEMRLRSVTDYSHPNSLFIDRDGNYVVSWRHLGEVNKINSRTGDIMWRLGGRNNQFRIVGDPLGGFSAQHMAHVLENGNLLLFDNGTRHSPPESRAVEYRLDTRAMTATMVWQYRHSPQLFTPYVSGAERLSNGNTVIGYGVIATIVEVRPDGRPIWEARPTFRGKPAIFYRAHRIPSLYRFNRP